MVALLKLNTLRKTQVDSGFSMKNVTILLIFTLFSIRLHATVLFEDDFDDQPDWSPEALNTNSDRIGNSAVIPFGWDYYLVNELWNAAIDGGEDSNPAISINGKDVDKVYGFSGKAFINYKESALSNSNNYTSDGILLKNIQPTNQLYVEFRIKFQPGFANNFPPDMTPQPPDNKSVTSKQFMLKIFRAMHYDGSGSRSAFFSIGNSAPIYLYDWAVSDFGVRHNHAFRCDPQETNYKCSSPNIVNDYPREVSNGSMSANYTSNLAAFNPDLRLTDYQDGGILPVRGTASHDQVFADKWHKLGFYLQLNSGPGEQDGVLKHWFDGKLILEMNHIPWIGTNGDADAKWNSFAIGGNAHFHFNLNQNDPLTSRERWYAIDNVLVLDAEPKKPKPITDLRITN
jgi:hypothetical protein